jgi:hypothetical protein
MPVCAGSFMIFTGAKDFSMTTFLTGVYQGQVYMIIVIRHLAAMQESAGGSQRIMIRV